LTPGSLRLESDQEGRWPSSLTRPSAQLGIRDAPPGHAFRGETLQRCRPGCAGPERGSTASRWTRWISIPPPFVTGSCRRVDLDPAAKWI